MEAIANRWRDKPKNVADSVGPEAKEEAGVKPVASVSGTQGKKNPTLLLAEMLHIEGGLAVMHYDTGATAYLVSSNFIRKLNLFSRGKRVQVSVTSGLEGEAEEVTLMHELYIRWPRSSAHACQFLEGKIQRLPQPPAEDVLNEMFPYPDREDWMADWGLTEGEVDILLGVDMIHLFPKLNVTMGRLSLYLSFITERYMVMGQMPDNSPEEQQERFERRLASYNQRIEGPHSVITRPHRMEALACHRLTISEARRGPGSNDAQSEWNLTRSAVSRTAPREPVLTSAVLQSLRSRRSPSTNN